MPTIVNIAAYRYFPFDSLEERRTNIRALANELRLRGTVLISLEGINMFVAGERALIDEFLSYIRGSHPELKNLEVKESLTDYQPFQRMVVKIKREIVPVGTGGVLEVETARGTIRVEPKPNATPKLKPQELKAWLDSGKEVTLIDTRNAYETDLGTFKNAIDFRLKTFRDFPKAAAELPEGVRRKPVVMFCTGGIRCEKIGPYMKGLGFENIYQLEGGILKYFEECEQAHYDGDCFVFDQRVAVNAGLKPSGYVECFACRHALTEEDVKSPKYVVAKSCPYCYQDPEIARRQHQDAILKIAKQQLGTIPYENKRWVSIPRRFAGLPLLDALEGAIPGYGREAWESAIHAGLIQDPRRDLAPVDPQYVTKEGDRFLHLMPNTTEPEVSSEIELIYEDEAVVVVNKGAPLPVHPSGRFNKNTLVAILEQVYAPERLRPCHRLDANTTGLTILARRHQDAIKIQTQFSEGTVSKTYLVVVEGVVPWDSMVCEAAISQESLPNGGRRIDREGAVSKTEFRVRKRQEARTILEATPLTGRTHQIRLHAAYLGYPVVNDPLYLAGGESRELPKPELARAPLGLHCWKMSVRHPRTQDTVSWVAQPSNLFWGEPSQNQALLNT
jgi:RluA family pseudouridine synthase